MKFFFCKTTEPCVSNVVKECFLDVCVFCADWNSKMAATNMAKINIGPTGKIFSSQDLQNILKQIYTWSFTKIMVFSLIGNGHYWTILCDCLFFFANSSIAINVTFHHLSSLLPVTHMTLMYCLHLSVSLPMPSCSS